jgi:O-antigen/teichoic acid export membrane protein
MLAPDLIALLYGGNYLAGWLSAVNAFRWLSVAVGFVFVTPVLATALLADGRERWLLVLSLLGLLFNVGANLVLVPRWGFTAAAGVTAATELLVCLGAVVMFQKAVGGMAVRVRWAWVLLPAAAVGLVLPAVQGSYGMRVACGVALGAAGAAVLLSSPAARRLRRAIAEAETGWPYSGN